MKHFNKAALTLTFLLFPVSLLFSSESKEIAHNDLQEALMGGDVALIDLPRLPSDEGNPEPIIDLELGDIRMASAPSVSSIRPSRWDRCIDFCKNAPGFVLTKVSTASAALSQVTAASVLYHAFGLGKHFYGLLSDAAIDTIYRADAGIATGCIVLMIGALYYNLQKYGQPILEQLKELIKKNPSYAVIIIDTLVGMAAAAGVFVDWAVGDAITPEVLYAVAAGLTTTLNSLAFLKYLAEKILETCKAIRYRTVPSPVG